MSEQQTQSPTPACKQSTSGCRADACPTCRIMPDDPSFCMRLNNIRIHQALALPCAQGATEDESAYLFAETTWKMACAAVSPPVRYEDHVPEYLANGVWRKHPYILQNRHIKVLALLIFMNKAESVVYRYLCQFIGNMLLEQVCSIY